MWWECTWYDVNENNKDGKHIVFCDDFVAEEEFELSDLDLKESLRQQQKFMTGSGNKKSESITSPTSSNSPPKSALWILHNSNTSYTCIQWALFGKVITGEYIQHQEIRNISSGKSFDVNRSWYLGRRSGWSEISQNDSLFQLGVVQVSQCPPMWSRSSKRTWCWCPSCNMVHVHFNGVRCAEMAEGLSLSHLSLKLPKRSGGGLGLIFNVG